MEKIKKRVLRVILNDYESNYEERLAKIGQPLMYICKRRDIAL